jgi:hypothetical protein
MARKGMLMPLSACSLLGEDGRMRMWSRHLAESRKLWEERRLYLLYIQWTYVTIYSATVMFGDVLWSNFPPFNFVVTPALLLAYFNDRQTAFEIFRFAPGMSSNVPTSISISGCLVSYQVKVPPHSRQKPLRIPFDDSKVL